MSTACLDSGDVIGPRYAGGCCTGRRCHRSARGRPALCTARLDLASGLATAETVWAIAADGEMPSHAQGAPDDVDDHGPDCAATSPGSSAPMPAIRRPPKSNALYRTNLAKGQTGLSIAFDLPTQTGYDSDHPLARGEVGKVGVPIAHLGDMRTLFDGIPLAEMNTSMTINATAPWLLALYIAVADEQGAPRATLQGTTQNDIIKEYLSRGTYVFPPAPSLRLTKDVILFTTREIAEVEPDERLLLSPAGSGRDAGAGTRLRAGHRHRRARHGAQIAARCRDERSSARSSAASPSSSTPASASSPNCARCAPSPNCGTRSCDALRRRSDEKHRRFRYGVQVNSLGLTEQQPENNVYRILIEMLAVILSKNARARAVQLPAWNEALGLPRPWDQQWSLRMQQIMAYETDLLEYRRHLRRQPRGRRARSRRSRPRRRPNSPPSTRWAARSPRSKAAT